VGLALARPGRAVAQRLRLGLPGSIAKPKSANRLSQISKPKDPYLAFQ
jgi:hypothetical protein